MDAAAVSRVIQGVVAGMGFLGAGAILKQEKEDRILGLTAASGIWLTAAAGLGRLASAVVGTSLALLILTVVHRLDQFLHRRHEQEKSMNK
jgi:putative Mg2+ transporter-C (MgtC) family protein